MALYYCCIIIAIIIIAVILVRRVVCCCTQFVAHPNCQQHLTSIWFGPQMGFMQSLNLWKKLLLWIVCVPLMPFFCIIYIIAPDCKVSSHHSFLRATPCT